MARPRRRAAQVCAARAADPDLVATIGQALVCERQAGVPWKDLSARFGYGKTKLWEIWRAGLALVADAYDVRERHGTRQAPRLTLIDGATHSR